MREIINVKRYLKVEQWKLTKLKFEERERERERESKAIVKHGLSEWESNTKDTN